VATVDAVHQVQHAIRVFVDHFEDIGFGALAIGVGCHLAKTLCTSRAWQNVIAAAYPGERVRWRSIYAAYIAGVGVNAIVPARSGDILRLYLTRRAVPSATYTTLGATYAVMAIFDSMMALGVFAYALTLGVLPGLHVLPSLPDWDFGWFLRNPRFTETLGVVLALVAVVLFVWARRRARAFKARVRQAFTVMRTPRIYLRRVAFWQACDWALRFVTVWFFLRAFGVPDTARNVLLVLVTSSLATIASLTTLPRLTTSSRTDWASSPQAVAVITPRQPCGPFALHTLSTAPRHNVSATSRAVGLSIALPI